MSASFHLIQTGWSTRWHVVRGTEDYADRFRARCGRAFDGEFAHYAPAGAVSVDDLCARCARIIGADKVPGGVISLGRPR